MEVILQSGLSSQQAKALLERTITLLEWAEGYTQDHPLSCLISSAHSLYSLIFVRCLRTTQVPCQKESSPGEWASKKVEQEMECHDQSNPDLEVAFSHAGHHRP
jgi:hypothetical protein